MFINIFKNVININHINLNNYKMKKINIFNSSYVSMIGANDCKYIPSILNDDEIDTMFYKIKNETKWDHMKHLGGDVPRMIAIEGESKIININNKQIVVNPLYRHPADSYPIFVNFTNHVKLLRDRVEDVLGHPRGYFNHCLVQLYPNGQSYISDHSDKTLDIIDNTDIINISLGAMRYMKIKNKIKKNDGSRESGKIGLENGSVFVLGWETNKKFYHGINQDNREDKFKSLEELAFNGERISLTFRNIGTFIDDKNNLYGKGARKEFSIIPVVDEPLEMLKAFGKENRDTDFDPGIHYKNGFNCIDLSLLEK